MIENAVFTTLCMVEDKNKNVLVQECIGGNWAGIVFPGGHVEIGGSFVRSVIREVFEETGYTIENPKLCGIKQFPTDDGARYVILLFKTNRFFGELKSSDEGRVFWVKYEKLNEYDLAVDMLEMLQLFKDDTKSEFYYYKDEANKWQHMIL